MRYKNNSLMYSGPTNVRGNYEVVGRAAPPQAPGRYSRGIFNPDPSWAIPDWAAGPDGVDGFGAAPAPGNYTYKARVYPGFGATPVSSPEGVVNALTDAVLAMLKKKLEDNARIYRVGPGGEQITASNCVDSMITAQSGGFDLAKTQMWTFTCGFYGGRVGLKAGLKKLMSGSMQRIVGNKGYASQAGFTKFLVNELGGIKVAGTRVSSVTGQALFNTIIGAAVGAVWAQINVQIAKLASQTVPPGSRPSFCSPPAGTSFSPNCPQGSTQVPAGRLPEMCGVGVPYFKCVSTGGGSVTSLVVPQPTVLTTGLLTTGLLDPSVTGRAQISTGDKAISTSNKALPYLLAGGTALALGVGLYLLRRK